MCCERVDSIIFIFFILKSFFGGDIDSSFSNRVDVVGYFYGFYYNNSLVGF